MARLYAILYNYKNSYGYLQQGIEYAEKTESKQLLAESYFTAGKLFFNYSVNKDIALEYLLQAKNLFSEINNNDQISWVELCIGNIHNNNGNDSLAMQYFKKVSKKANKTDYSLLSQTYHLIGIVFKKKQQYDSALVYLQKSIDAVCKVCPEIIIHNTLLGLADTYLVKGNYKQTLIYLNRAKDIAVKSKSGLKIVISNEELAKYYQVVQNTDCVVYYLTSAYKLAEELSLFQRIKKSAKSLSNIYYSKKEFKTSSDYLRVSNRIIDSLANIERYKETAKLEMRFEIKKEEQERQYESELLQNEISKQKLIRNSSIVGAVLFIVIGLFLLKAYKRKRKDNLMLAKQKGEIQEISNRLLGSEKRKLDFFTNISHEIRTPLTLIKASLERIHKSSIINNEIHKQLQPAIDNTNRLKDLVNQILDLQKLEQHKLVPDLSEFEIISFCKDILLSFEGYSYQKGCKLIFESNIGNTLIRFDQIRLRSIINNLLSNAFKYNKEGGLIHFKIEVNSNNIKLEISDTGIGISRDQIKKLRKRYYQVEKSGFAVEGTGIGLAYVKELVELMKGELEISSTVNEGTTVIVSLPCNDIKIFEQTPVKLEIKPKEETFLQLEEQISGNTENQLPRILIIEDNFELLYFLRDLFSESYHVICAKDGQEGKEKALKYLPDLIISDIMMPGIRGNELCKMLKDNINTSHITIILFTAKGAPDSIVNGYDCGADDYIVKPFSSNLLVKKVENIISTAENAKKQFSFSKLERSNVGYSKLDKKFLEDCITITKDNIENCNFTVELLAENLNIHRRTLLRKFKTLTGKLPIEIIKHYR